MTGAQVIEHLGHALVRDDVEVNAQLRLQHGRTHVVQCAHPSRADAQHTGLGFSQADKVGELGDGQLRVGHERERTAGNSHQKAEVLFHVVAHGFSNGWHDAHVGAGAQQQGLAVGL